MKKLNRVGEKYLTKEGYWIEIIEYFNKRDCTIKFSDENILKNVSYINIKIGSIKNPMHPNVFGVGYLGQGNYKGRNSKTYVRWSSMLQRCYSTIYHIRQPTYSDCLVCEEWHNYQNFAEWFEENYIEEFTLDKDILVKNNRVYSPETCCFVPQEINSLFTIRQNNRGELPIGITRTIGGFVAKVSKKGYVIHLGTFDTIEEAFQAYKTTKEAYIKEVADEWKPLIKLNVYQAMYNYKVEITD